jgi:pSer/pThr/pTyr-binding forkhead associated (FHA) protein/Flp pilus assembly protein TadD
MNQEALLTVTRAGQSPQVFKVEAETLLGRSKDCGIFLDDRAISRQHAVFKWAGRSFQVEKKSQFAPLSVNGAECAQAVLQAGDVIHLGPYSIELSFPKSNPIASAPEPLEGSPASEVLSSVQSGDAFVPSGALEVAPQQSPAPAKVSDVVAPADPLAEPSSTSGDPLAELALGVDAPAAQASDIPGMTSSELPQDPAQDPPSNEGAAGGDGFDSPPEDDGKTKITPSAQITAELIFKPGEANHELFVVTKAETLIGRGQDCDIILADKKASRKNTLIRRAGLQFTIKDLESVNGTVLNGVTITTAELTGDDTIQIGDAEFQFRVRSANYEAEQQNFASVAISEDPEPAAEEEVEPAVELGPESQMGFGSGFDQAGVPGQDLTQIPGVIGLETANQGNRSLMEKFRALPPLQRLIVTGALLAFFYWFMDDDAKPKPTKKVAVKAGAMNGGPQPSAGPASVSFERLTPAQQQFVEAQHALAFDYYKNKDFDKALFEIQKIFVLITEYKDSREIERYAKEGKRKIESLEEEKRKKDEEIAFKAKIRDLEEAARAKMKSKNFEAARELFSEIMTIDPDNAAVVGWKKEIEAFEEAKKNEVQRREAQRGINAEGLKIFKQGLKQADNGKYYPAIATLKKVPEIGTSDRKLLSQAVQAIAQIKLKIQQIRDPILAQAKTAEEGGDSAGAYKLFQKATQVDPHHRAGYDGMGRIHSVLHERAKSAYTEAVIAENYSDFDNAERLYHVCLDVAPVDDIYHDRAIRKLAKFVKFDSGGSTPPQPEASQPASPPLEPASPPQDLAGAPQGTPAAVEGGAAPPEANPPPTLAGETPK